MNTAHTTARPDETDFLLELFGPTPTAEEQAAMRAQMALAQAAELARCEAARAELAAARNRPGVLRCRRCMGSGKLGQFAHIKNGECFACAGSGIAARG